MLLFMFFGRGPLGAEPGFAALEGFAYLLRDANLPWFGVVC